MIDRRTMLLGVATLPFTSSARARCGPPLLSRAIERAGGAARLMAVRKLYWTGSAQIHAGDRTIDIGLSTWIEPFGAARSDSWLATEGPDKTRSLILDGDGTGWIERSATRVPMPAAMAAHERQQYALYGLMLLAPLCADPARVSAVGSHALDVVRRPAPPTTLFFDEGAALIAARNTVSAPGGGAPILQDISFGSSIAGASIRWPQTLSIRHGGRPYFDLQISTFNAV